MELNKQKKKLVTAVKGHKLLKDKRDELMRQFLDLARENMALRLKVDEGIANANKNFVIAKAGMSEQILNTALMAPKQEVYLEAGKKNVMSVDIPVFQSQTRTADANDIYSYGFAFTSGDLDGAVKSLADILPDMLRLAAIIVNIVSAFFTIFQTTDTATDGGFSFVIFAQVLRVGQYGFQELQRNNLHSVIIHFVDARHTNILDYSQMSQIFLTESHPETCTFNGWEVFHQRFQFFVI